MLDSGCARVPAWQHIVRFIGRRVIVNVSQLIGRCNRKVLIDIVWLDV